jgi:hypothetical protein
LTVDESEHDSARILRLLKKESRAFGEFCADDDAEGVLREEGRHSPHRRAECTERRGRLLVSKLFDAEGFCRAAERSAQAVEREVSSGERKAARLKISERVEHDPLGVNDARRLLRVKE